MGIEVLLELVSGAGLVRRDDQSIVVTTDVREGRGQPLRDGDRYLPIKTGLPEQRCLIGGLLPPRVAGVEAVDDLGGRVAATIGNGVYAAILDHPDDGQEPVVCCRDRAGAIVPLPIPDEYPRTRIGDAEEPCPACGAIDYDECIPTEDWQASRSHGGGPTETSPIVVCRVCGHQEREGAIARFGSADDSEDEAQRAERIARWRAERRVQRWYENAMTLRSVTFAIYASPGWPIQLNGSSARGKRTTGITVAHTRLADTDLLQQRADFEVTTETEPDGPSGLARARRTLEHLVHDQLAGRNVATLSDGAITLYFRALDRRRRAASLSATRSTTAIPVDGAQVDFLLLSTASGWVAVGRHGSLAITIAARDVEPGQIALQPITDPRQTLLGPQPEHS